MSEATNPPAVAAADLQAVREALAEPFDPSEVKWKPQMVKGTRALAVAYVDARVIQDRLDEVLGVDGWQDELSIVDDNNVVCRLSCRIGTEWVSKTDIGSPSEQPDGGDRIKAAFSDAFKRAAVKFGIARYLYRLPSQWVDYDAQRKQIVKPPPLPDDALPRWMRKSAAKAPAAKPAPPAALPPAKPKAEDKPAEPAKAGALPSSGSELLRRLQAKEAKMAADGLCKPGELLAHVSAAGDKAGYGPDVGAWDAATMDLAAAEVRAFEAKQRQKHKAEVKAVA